MGAVTAKDFSMDQKTMAVAIAAVEGSATIHGHDPIARRDFTLVITRHYVNRAVADGWPLDGETKE